MFKSQLFTFLFCTLLLAGCKEAPPVPEPDSRPAKLFAVSVGNNDLVRTFPAIAQAGDKAVMAFRVPGQLSQLNVNSGDLVERGDILAALNPDEYELLQKQARANFELANVQYQRMKKLRKDQVVSEQDFDKALATYKSANASLDQASANLSYTSLIAPYAGTVSIVNVENHEYISVNQPVMNVQTTSVLKIEFQLPGYLLNRFRGGPNKKATMTFDSFPQESFSVQLLEIDTEADSKTNSYKTTLVMDRPDEVGVLPGMSGQVRVSLPKTDATDVPDSALFTENEKQYVWRVNEEGLTEKVEIVLSEKGTVESGLNDGDLVVISGVAGVEEGTKVREWIKERGL
ncbi:efflux RND transporter periplasmic adaptor subunit [Vibrio algarum]|uniref:Efflux RND transporter periplasmic adaptor subunit n=1 Tax=Vibrio algarum TaxID=3020714 RepID=A0ABT4YQ13_9VIBR|nr:efflux RND transporter periplasmic adaptor subunit [Vibrio sp. KJ40-1]MDB1123642.1 efflux RND transporter periplasmic adaptor subunit [Vibrio sp. KJ40-1]